MLEFSIQEMLGAGVHFGHKAKRWNPKMKPYIYGTRDGVHIIDLEKTYDLLQKSVNFARSLIARGENLLFVGTKRQAMGVVEEEAKRAKMPYVVTRWLGGTLTNFSTIQKSINKLKEIEGLLAEGSVEKLHKKEIARLEKKQNHLLANLGGIRSMKRLPGALFLIDIKKERIALREANKLGIPVIALVDTNGDPDGVDYIIPGNDDAIKSIGYISKVIADACIEGIEAHKRELLSDRETAVASKEMEGEEKPHEVEVIIRKGRRGKTERSRKDSTIIIDDEEE